MLLLLADMNQSLDHQLSDLPFPYHVPSSVKDDCWRGIIHPDGFNFSLAPSLIARARRRTRSAIVASEACTTVGLVLFAQSSRSNEK
jgi:hypothetical protein